MLLMTCFNMRPNTHPLINRINHFLALPHYIVAVMFLTGAANLFHLELPVYALFAATAIFICCFGNDLLLLLYELIFMDNDCHGIDSGRHVFEGNLVILECLQDLSAESDL